MAGRLGCIPELQGLVNITMMVITLDKSSFVFVMGCGNTFDQLIILHSAMVQLRNSSLAQVIYGVIKN